MVRTEIRLCLGKCFILQAPYSSRTRELNLLLEDDHTRKFLDLACFTDFPDCSLNTSTQAKLSRKGLGVAEGNSTSLTVNIKCIQPPYQPKMTDKTELQLKMADKPKCAHITPAKPEPAHVMPTKPVPVYAMPAKLEPKPS
ncbi:hypothetical protein Baya_2895 [Bagarius yarrelli]|uniref:Uncharacterized protein n=1 Tax=Bagarius yarrelli TaxID=175774 RepID=A0A556TQU0_BAGYA|nr:hypothetical protein Baya_2895 [Bagarius yarrelli]